MFFKISQNSQENTGARVPILTSENFKKFFFTEHLRTAASDSISNSKIYIARTVNIYFINQGIINSRDCQDKIAKISIR